MDANQLLQQTTNLIYALRSKIPWIGKSFIGFLGFFLLEGKRYDFATYTGATIGLMSHSPQEVNIRINSGKYILDVIATKGTGGKLLAPESGNMQRIIHECIDAEITVQLTDNKGSQLFLGTGTNAGLEITGDPNTLNNPLKS
jgi:tocopherol cyclase